MKVQPRNADAFLGTAWKKVRAVLVYGPDAGLVRERAKALIAAGTDTVKFPFALAEVAGAAFKDAPSRLADELAAVPFGGGRRVVHVRDLSDWRMADRCAESVEIALGAWPGDALLVVEAGELKPRAALRRIFEESDSAAAVACYPDDAEAVRRLIGAVAREHKLQVSSEAEDFLVERLGSDRLATRGELEKLALYAGDGGRVDLADAQSAIGDGGESTVDEAVHAAFRGDPVSLDRALDRCDGKKMGCENMSASEPYISVKDIHKSFAQTEVLKGISFDIAKGEAVCIIGPSGSGKSTLLRCLNGLATIDRGTVRVGTHDVHAIKTDAEKIALRKDVSMVFQQFNLFPHKTALENIMMAPIHVLKQDKAEVEEQIGRAHV